MRYMTLMVSAVIVSFSCKLTEVTIPTHEPLTVVHAVMRPDLAQQWVLVEESLSGTAPESDGAAVVPGNDLELPVTDAIVTIDNVSHAADPCGHPIVFNALPVDPARTTAGVYWSPPGCPSMRPGDSLLLQVRRLDGAIVVGRTEVPGIRAISIDVHGERVELPSSIRVAFNRDIDTMVGTIDPLHGRGLQAEVHRVDVGGDVKHVTQFFVDSTSVSVPGDLIDVFSELGNGAKGDSTNTHAHEIGDDVFRAGWYYRVALAWLSRSYFDFVRSANSPLSGRGYINHLEGGYGVFGSLIAASVDVRVVGNVDDRREGQYRIRGEIHNVPVDIVLEAYAVRSNEDSTAVSAFVRGAWFAGEIDGSVDGHARNDTMAVVVHQAGPDSVSSFLLDAVIPKSGSFPVTVRDHQLDVVATLTGVRLTAAAERN